ESRIGPAELGAGAFYFLGAERGAMGGGGTGFGRRAVSDGGAAGNQTRAVARPGGGDGACNGVGIMAVDAHRSPTSGPEAGALIVADGEAGRPVDGDAVVVEKDNELVQPKMPRERNRLMADPLHEAAVAGDRISVLIAHLRPELRRQHALGERHADGIAKPLAERPRGGFDSGRMPVFGVAGGAAAELAEVADLRHRHLRIAGEIEERIKQHRAMPG